MFSLSVVIPTYNRRDTLKLVLESLEKQTLGKGFEVLICDSSSTDGTVEMLSKIKVSYPLRYLRQDNKGRSGARNLGIKEAQGEIVLFTDADIIAGERLLEEHLKFHQQFGDVAVVGCEVQVNSLEELSWYQRKPGSWNPLHPPHRKEVSWMFFLTGNASVSRKTLLKVGMFDEAFKGYGMEDLELGYRIYKSGIPIKYNSHAINFHLHPLILEERCKLKRFSGMSAAYFYKKHRDWRIKYLLGMNPLVMGIHSLLSPRGIVIRACRKKALKKDGCISDFCKEVLLQYHYLCGVKEGLRLDNGNLTNSCYKTR